MNFTFSWLIVLILYFNHNADDGDEDILIVPNVGKPLLYENVDGNQASWLRVRVAHKYVYRKNILFICFVSFYSERPAFGQG